MPLPPMKGLEKPLYPEGYRGFESPSLRQFRTVDLTAPRVALYDVRLPPNWSQLDGESFQYGIESLEVVCDVLVDEGHQ